MSCPSYAPVPVLRRELVKELRTGGLRFTESWHEAGSTIPLHAHQQATITILVDGSFDEEYPLHRAMSCVAPAVHVRPPGERHVDRLGRKGAHNLVLEIDEERFGALRQRTALFDQLRHLRNPETLRMAADIQRELAIADAASGLALEGLALELLGVTSRALSEREKAPPAWLLRVRDRLHDCFADPGLRMAELATEAGVHPVHLARAFRKHFGTSPGSYLRQVRGDWAVRQVRETDLPLVEIANAAGFADQSHLGRAFKRLMGTSPAAWRRARRE